MMRQRMKHGVFVSKRMSHTYNNANVIACACVPPKEKRVKRVSRVCAMQKADSAEILTCCVSHMYAGYASDESDSAPLEQQFIQAANVSWV